MAETEGSGVNKLWKDRWKAARASLSTSAGTVTEMEMVGLFAWLDVLAVPSRPQTTHWQRIQVDLTNYTAITEVFTDGSTATDNDSWQFYNGLHLMGRLDPIFTFLIL